ncbi:MAG: protease HtpX, partial [Deltaproteobacteria bacterium]
MRTFVQQLKTGVLLAALTGVLVGLGSLAGREAATFALVLGLGMNLAAYLWSDRMVLAMHRARPLSPAEAPEVHRIVEELAARAKIPKPAVYLVEDPQPNAFATGRGPSRSAVAVTTGILQILDARELRGVLAHEIGHVVNRDVLVATVA